MYSTFSKNENIILQKTLLYLQSELLHKCIIIIEINHNFKTIFICRFNFSTVISTLVIDKYEFIYLTKHSTKKANRFTFVWITFCLLCQGVTFRVEGGELVIARILHGGMIDQQGLLHVGDIIKEVNGKEVGSDPKVLQNMLKESSGSVVLKILPSYQEPHTPRQVSNIQIYFCSVGNTQQKIVTGNYKCS